LQSFELHLTVETPINAVELLQAHCALSKGQIKDVMHKGAVWQSQGKKTIRLRRAKKQLNVGQTLHLYYNEQALSEDFTKPQLIDDCGEYSIWNKPCGMMSQGSKWGDHSTISRYAEVTLAPQRSAFIVHRLDRATHGVILVAHTKNAVRKLTNMFEQRQITKKYQTVVHGRFAETQEFTGDIDERSAYTKASNLTYDQVLNVSLLDIEIGSGRKHQIRRHLSEAHFPIVGDRLYGNDENEVDLQLCAYHLSYHCPVLDIDKHIEIAPSLMLGRD